MSVADIVVAAQSLIRTKSLMLYGRQCGFINVGARNVPTRREARFVQDQRPFRIGDDAVPMTDYQPARGLADIDAVVAVGGMAHDPFVFFVESVHGRPRKS